MTLFTVSSAETSISTLRPRDSKRIVPALPIFSPSFKPVAAPPVSFAPILLVTPVWMPIWAAMPPE